LRQWAPHFKVIIYHKPSVIESLKEHKAAGVSAKRALYDLSLSATEITDPNREVESVIKDLGFTRDKSVEFTGVGYIRNFRRL